VVSACRDDELRRPVTAAPAGRKAGWRRQGTAGSRCPRTARCALLAHTVPTSILGCCDARKARSRDRRSSAAQALRNVPDDCADFRRRSVESRCAARRRNAFSRARCRVWRDYWKYPDHCTSVVRHADDGYSQTAWRGFSLPCRHSLRHLASRRVSTRHAEYLAGAIGINVSSEYRYGRP